jgi:membrane-bound lytic murein transglycosylase B
MNCRKNWVGSTLTGSLSTHPMRQTATPISKAPTFCLSRCRPAVGAAACSSLMLCFSARKFLATVSMRPRDIYGVPGPVLVAISGLETDFGAALGKYPTFSAVAMLAYDCRRADLYRAELIDALMIVQRGLLAPEDMRGAWAGELGQTQFMPSAYLKYGVSSNGGRGGNLIGNSADALASTANFLKQRGWQPEAGWDPGDPNFAALLEWNNAEVYARTIAQFADRLGE